MPLTRSLYREDEVLAALKFCVLKGRGQEAIFWAQEALDSEMRTHVLQSLFWVWLLGVGPANCEWLFEFHRAVSSGRPMSDEDIQSLVMRLAREPSRRRDGTAFALLGLGLGDLPQERTGCPEIPIFSYDPSPAEIVAARAIRQGKLAFAWGLLAPVWRDETWLLLQECCGTEQTKEVVQILSSVAAWDPLGGPEFSWPIRAAALSAASALGVGTAAAAANAWTPPAEWTNSRSEWLQAPMRRRRIYTPPDAALFWFTARGSLSVQETTEHELLEGLEAAMEGSFYWRLYVPNVIRNDELRECFYDTYFPTDIPDEWSQKDRAVSHGHGTVSNPATLDVPLKLRTALQGWFGTLPCTLWKGIPAALDEITSLLAPQYKERPDFLEAIAAAYKKKVAVNGLSEGIMGDLMRCVKKKLVIP